MTEGLLTDSAAEDGQAEAAPADEGNDFAFPAEETQATAPEPEGEQTGSADSASNAATSDEGQMLRADYTRKTQDLADERRQLAEERHLMAEERQQERDQWQAHINAMTQSINPEEPSTIARALQNPDLSAEDRAGLEYLQASEQEQNTLRDHVGAMAQQMEHMQQRLDWAYGHLEGQHADQRGAADVLVKDQFAEADEAFGVEKTQAAAWMIEKLWGDPQGVNSQGEPLTIKEIVAMAHNLPADQAQDAMLKQTNGRSQAKRAASPPQTSPADVPQQGPLSESEAMAVIKSTM